MSWTAAKLTRVKQFLDARELLHNEARRQGVADLKQMELRLQTLYFSSEIIAEIAPCRLVASLVQTAVQQQENGFFQQGLLQISRVHNLSKGAGVVGSLRPSNRPFMARSELPPTVRNALETIEEIAGQLDSSEEFIRLAETIGTSGSRTLQENFMEMLIAFVRAQAEDGDSNGGSAETAALCRAAWATWKHSSFYRPLAKQLVYSHSRTPDEGAESTRLAIADDLHELVDFLTYSSLPHLQLLGTALEDFSQGPLHQRIMQACARFIHAHACAIQEPPNARSWQLCDLARRNWNGEKIIFNSGNVLLVD
ncbi:MAG: hypothetical protein ACE5OZ_13135 [Candidatus Heimdallarchaeota archaeon]